MNKAQIPGFISVVVLLLGLPPSGRADDCSGSNRVSLPNCVTASFQDQDCSYNAQKFKTPMFALC